MSFSGAVKAARNQKLAFRKVLCDVASRRTTQNAARPAIGLCQKRGALMLLMSPTETVFANTEMCMTGALRLVSCLAASASSNDHWIRQKLHTTWSLPGCAPT